MDFKHVGPNIINILGFFSNKEISEEYFLPFASSQTPILFIATSDDQIFPSVRFVSTDNFSKYKKKCEK